MPRYTERDITFMMEDTGLPRSKVIMLLENPPVDIKNVSICPDCEKENNLNKEEKE